ncbi:30S ribosomal protein S3 [archaeon HR06]|nr:30S ribosomal protein S3 [archaeon HR06]
MSMVKELLKTHIRNAELDEFLAQELKEAGYGGCEVQRTPLGTRITIYVLRPGLVIGVRGVGIKSLTEKIEKKFNLQNPQLVILEVEVPELNPYIMANRITKLMAKGIAFRRAAIWALNTIMRAGALGAEIVISGKLRSDRAHYEKFRAGIIPKSGYLSEVAVSEGKAELLLKLGMYGVKVKIARKEAIIPEFSFKEVKQVEGAEGEGSKEVGGEGSPS